MPKITVYRRRPSQADTELTKLTRERKHNFLKYWRIVRYWARRKYGLTDSELELLLYLYDIDLFSRKDFQKFEGVLEWDKKRLADFIEKGYIGVWRDHVGYSKQAKMYELTVKAKRICSSIYKKLTQEEHIPETGRNNPIFRGQAYADIMYRKLIKKMNSERENSA